MVLLLDEPAYFRRDDGVVIVSGPDRLEYLNSLMSQQFAGVAAGEVLDFLYLDAKGTAQAAGRAVVRTTDVVLLTPPEVAASLTEALQRYTFLMEVTSADVSGTWAVASVRGPGQVDVFGAPSRVLRAVPRADGMVVRDRSGGVDLVGPVEWVAEGLATTSLPEAAVEQWEAWRISAGEAAWGSEITAGRRPQELGLLATHVHLRKGCYPGQESIAKIYNLGRPRRALAIVELDGPVAPGDAIDAGGKAGEVTSVASIGDGWVALALVPVTPEGHVVADAVTVRDVRGRVRRLVGEGLAIPGALAR